MTTTKYAVCQAMVVAIAGKGNYMADILTFPSLISKDLQACLNLLSGCPCAECKALKHKLENDAVFRRQFEKQDEKEFKHSER